MKVDVSLDLYRIFCAVVRTGNMSAAARELFISQPAVSMSIRQLEDRMGSPLLVRTAKGVYPTAEGKLLYTYLEQALGLIQAAEEKYYQMVHMESLRLARVIRSLLIFCCLIWKSIISCIPISILR